MALNSSLLFSLPLELREAIYKEVFAAPSQGSQLLHTCREIRSEAYKYLFQRPLHFSSQEALSRWLERSPRPLLRHVTAIHLTVTDIKTTPLIDNYPALRSSASPPALSTHKLYGSELEKVKQSLQELPNIKTITIRAPVSLRDHFYQHLLAKVLSMLGLLYPMLTDLRLEGDMQFQSLTCLRSLTHLKSFSFDGFSASTPMEIAEILAGLKNLSRLSLVSPQGTVAPRSARLSSFTPKSQSFTDHVIRTMNELAFPAAESAEHSLPALLTPEVLAVLDKHKTLHHLSISSLHAPDDERLQALQSFLERSAISCLELDWPNLTPELLEGHSLLPDHLEVLWARTMSGPEAFHILQTILRARQGGRMQALSKVVLIRSTADAVPKDSIDGARTALQALGIQTSWCTERH